MQLRSLASRVLLVSGATLLVVGPLSAGLAAATPNPAGTTWTGGKPLPPAPGLGLHRNEDGEPGMGVTPSGQFWIASDIAPYAADDPRVDPVAGVLSGADIWTSTDGGKTYKWVADPFAEAQNTFGLAGEDTDLAVASAKNSKGFYNVYATSLWIGDSGLAWSSDGGKTWQLNRLGGTPTQDRPWLAADGPCTIYLGFHQLPTFTPVFDSYDVCSNGNVPTSSGAALDPVHETQLTASDFPGLSGSFNKFVVDTSPTSKFRHNLYQPMSVCKTQTETDLVTDATASNCPQGTQYIVAVSSDRGQTFSYHPVALDPTGATLVWAATVATDAAGKVYFTWSDSKNSYLNVSTDGGKTWSASKKINLAGTSAVYPTVAGGGSDRVDVAWYGTPRAGDSNDVKKMGPPTKKGSAQWAVYLARSTNAGKSFTIRKVTGTIHLGVLCTHGSGCNSDGSRNLLDDFGLSISPKTGLDSISYTSDMPTGVAGKAFTGFTTEQAKVNPVTVGSRLPASPPSSGGAGGGGASLAATGAPLTLAVGGVVLMLVGFALRRRVTAG
ncbi:MAG TPA: hypothetical protein VFH66_16340 [Mycobacteriales bacterium]|nr:hypothetical protein [Mycobacteriales bacterium]